MENSGRGEVEVLASTRGAFLVSCPLVCPLAWLTERVKVCARPPSHPAWHLTPTPVELIFSTVQLLTGSGGAAR